MWLQREIILGIPWKKTKDAKQPCRLARPQVEGYVSLLFLSSCL